MGEPAKSSFSFKIPSFKQSVLSEKRMEESSEENAKEKKAVNDENQLNREKPENEDLEKKENFEKENKHMNVVNTQDSSFSQVEVPKFSLNFGSSIFGKSKNIQDEESERSLTESIEELSKNENQGKNFEIDSQPNSDFDLDNLQTQNSNLFTQSSNSIQSQIPMPALSNVKSKTVRLSNGEEFQLFPKTRSILTSSAKNIDYGININRIYEEMEFRAKSSNKTTKSKARGGPLWVEKYRPKNFLELIGNEKANRAALKWLRQWSSVVYKEHIVNKNEKEEDERFKDPLNRPRKRILLLHGPPGIGKTTIAHMMAKHFNYDIMEINASDERSGTQVQEKIYSGLDTITFSGKPTCIIADEIDGASENGFVRVLINIVFSDYKATSRIKRGNKEAKGKEKPLLRPIIAICNDLYAPVLEKLRPHCEIIAFKKPEESQIKERLEKVCESERLDISSKDLNSVVKISNMDIRSCLNLLQFNGDSFGDDNTESLRSKDSNIPWFKLVNLVFKLDLKSSKSESIANLQKILASSGSIEKVVNGCYRTYPEKIYNDPALISKSDILSDWMYFYDVMLNSKYQQNIDLSSYCNSVPLKFFSLFAEGHPKVTAYSSNDWEFFEKRKKNQTLCTNALSNNTAMKPSLYTSLNNYGFATTETLPIINNYILNPEPKRDVAYMVNILKDLGFKVDNVTNEQGIMLAIIPQLDSVTSFNSTVPIDTRRQGTLRKVLYETEKLKTVKRKIDTLEEEDHFDKRDFFTLYKELGTSRKMPKQEWKVWVKYHEGFSNAVRKPVSWNDLWQ